MKWGKKGYLMLPMQEIGVKTKNCGSYLLVLHFQIAEGIHMFKYNGSGWLRELLKQESVF
jgi:hypothetical protein